MPRLVRFAPAIAVLVVAAAITSAQMGRHDYRRGLSMWRFDQLIRERSSATNLVHDGIPRVAVKFDDGRDGQWDSGHVAAFLRRGIPVQLALNAYTITDASVGRTNPLDTSGSHLSWAQVRALADYAGQHGTSLSLANHTYRNWNNAAPWAMGYQTYLRETQPDTIEAHTGIRPKTFVYPGEPKNLSFATRNYNTVAATLDSMGYDYAIIGGEADSMGTGPSYISNGVPQDNVTGSQQSLGFVRPGVYSDPFWLHQGMWDIDATSLVVERDGGESWSNTSRWTIRQNGGGDVSSVTNWAGTWRTQWELRLANGCGFIASMHDSTDFNALNIPTWSGLSASESDGAFSPEHVAGTLKALEDAGLIVLVSVEEWCEWALSRYAPRTNLIGNPRSVSPAWAIGDTGGVEFGWIAGWGSPGWQTSTWNVTNFGVITQFDAGAGNAAKYNRAADDPGDVQGSSVVGWMGRPYGFKPVASSTIRFMQNLLRPGRYRLIIPSNHASSPITVQEFHIAAAGRWHNPKAQWGGTSSGYAYGDTVISYRWKDADVSFARPAAMDDEWNTDYFDFTIPLVPTFHATDLTNAVDDLWGSEAEQTSLFAQMWQDEWLWTVTLQFTQGSSALQVFDQVQFVYLGPTY